MKGLTANFSWHGKFGSTLLPELPQIQGYESDVLWQTARQVGGDFYDVFALNEQEYGI